VGASSEGGDFAPVSVENYELVTGSDRTQLSKNNRFSRYAISHSLLALAVLATAMAVGMLIMVRNKAKTDPHLVHRCGWPSLPRSFSARRF
jgi:hypothetical protein